MFTPPLVELTGIARSTFELVTIASVSLLSAVLLVSILSIPFAAGATARQRRLIEAGWTAVALAMLATLAAAVAGASAGA